MGTATIICNIKQGNDMMIVCQEQPELMLDKKYIIF